MKPALTCGLAALIGLTACSGVSTGLRSPCFERGGAQVTRGLNFASAPAETPAETDASPAIPGGADGCNFQDF